MTKVKLLLGGVAALGLATAALAHAGATGVVKERMDAMKSMGDAIKAIKPMMSGEAEYDAATVRDAAQTIERLSGKTMTGKFPEGSTGHPSEAKPEIWSDWERFQALAEDLAVAARGLGLAADNGLHGDNHMGQMGHMMGQQGMMGGTMMSTDGNAMMGHAAMSGHMTAEHLGQMPADGAYVMLTQVCSACHDRFRLED